MVNLYGGFTWRVSDFRQSIFDKLAEIGANGLAVAANSQGYIDNAVAWQLPEPLIQVLYGDQMRLGVSWLRNRGLKLCIYGTFGPGGLGAGIAGAWEYYGKVITDPAMKSQWIAQWKQVISDLQPDAFELIDECPDAALSGNSALTYDAYYNWAIECIDAYRAIKPDLNIMLTSCPFWDLHPIVAKPIPRPNITYAFHLHYFGTEPSPSWTPYAIAYDEGRLADAKALLETYLLDTCGIRAMLNAELDLSFVFGADYRTKPNWAAFLTDMYDFCRRHKIDSYFHYCWTTETPYEMGVWNTGYTALNVMGQLMATNMAIRMPVLTISSTTGGTTNPAPGGYIYTSGSSVVVTAIPSVNYRFLRWELDGTTRTENPITVVVNKDYSLNAVFEYVTPTPITYTLTISTGVGGTTSPASGNYALNQGMLVVATATPDADYKFVNWLLNGVTRTENPITIVMSQDYTLEPMFEYVTPPPLTATIRGYVKDAETAQPIVGAIVSTNGYADVTETNGYYAFAGIPAKTYSLVVQKEGYQTLTFSVDASAGGTFSVDVNLVSTAPPPPLTHSLVVTSTPIMGVPVTVDGYQHNTPTSPLTLIEGTHVVVAPSNVLVGSSIYNFTGWEDGSTNPVRTINLFSDMTVTATYELYTPPSPAKGYLQIHAFYEGAEVSATGSVNGIAIASTPVTLELDPEAYTITLTYAGKTKTKLTTVLEGQTMREDVEIAPPPTPISPIKSMVPFVAPFAIGTIISLLSLRR